MLRVGIGSVIEYRMSGRLYRQFFERYGGRGRAVLEATRNWYWMADGIQACGTERVLANPKQLKAIAWAKVKTDPVDADRLNELLRADIIPKAYVAPAEARHRRETLRYRA